MFAKNTISLFYKLKNYLINIILIIIPINQPNENIQFKMLNFSAF